MQQIELDLTVDFEQHELKGVAILDIQRQPGCPPDAPLDPRHPRADDRGGRPAPADRSIRQPFEPARFQLGPADPILGSKLTIELTPTATQVRIALPDVAREPVRSQWLDAVADGGEGQAVPVHPVGGDPCPVVDSACRTRRACGSPTPRRSASRRG